MKLPQSEYLMDLEEEEDLFSKVEVQKIILADIHF